MQLYLDTKEALTMHDTSCFVPSRGERNPIMVTDAFLSARSKGSYEVTRRCWQQTRHVDSLVYEFYYHQPELRWPKRVHTMRRGGSRLLSESATAKKDKSGCTRDTAIGW